MRYRELSETRKRQIRYGALAIAVLLLAAGVIAFSHSHPRSAANPDTDTAPLRRTAHMQAAPAASDADDDLAPAVSALRRDEAVDLIGEARITQALTRMREAVARRDFAAADIALNEAERIDIQNPSIRRARGELARARGAQANTHQ